MRTLVYAGKTLKDFTHYQMPLYIPNDKDLSYLSFINYDSLDFTRSANRSL